MAEEIKKVLEIDTSKSITSLKDYKKHIDELRASLLTLDETSQEYADIAAEIKNEQDKLNQVMAVGKKDADAADGSYNKLAQTMAELKKQWKATGDEAERDQLGKQIVEINDKLKELDASTGNFQRNVGNYETAFSNAFKNFGQSVGGAVPAVGKLGNALKLLAANPIGAVIMAVVLAVKTLSSALKGSEDQSNRMKVATAGLKVVIDGIKNAISKVVEVIVTLTTKVNEFIMKILTKLKSGFEALGWDKMAEKMGNTIQKMEEYQQLAEKEVDINKKRRELNLEIARTENQVSELRAKIADKEKYSDEERLKFIEEWEKAAKHKNDLQIQLAQEEYDIIKKNNSLTETSTADLDKENDALINLTKAQGAYSEELRTILRQKNTLIKEVNPEAAEDIEDEIQSTEELIKALEERLKLEGKLLEEKQRQAEFDVEYDQTLSEEEKAEKIFEIEQQTINDKISLQEQFLNSLADQDEKRLEAEESLSKLKRELYENEVKEKYRLFKQEQEQEAADEEAKAEQDRLIQQTKYKIYKQTFAALQMMAEDGSEEQKALAIMETTIDTIQAAVAAFKSMASIPVVGPALGAAAAAATTAFGIANINRIKNTKKGSSSNLNGTNPQVTPVNQGSIVRPMLNEEADLNKMNSIPVKQDSDQEQQNIKVYVTETDIADATHKAEVRDNNSTF